MTSAGEFEALLADLSEVKPAAGLGERSPLKRIAVIGAGPVGQALACECLAAECEVTLYTAFEPERSALARPGAVTVRGEHLVGSYRLAGSPSSEPAIALRTGIDDEVGEADAVLIATPAIAHGTYAGLLAGRLQAEQLLVLVPGRSFGAVEVARSLRRFASPSLPTIVEVAGSPYRLESPEPGMLTVTGIEADVPAAALPNRSTEEAVRRLATVLPMLSPARGILETSFSDRSGVIDVPPALLRESSAVAGRIDDERRRVAFAYGVRELPPTPRQAKPAPTLDVDDPRIHDALCCSLVPLVSAAAQARIPARTAAALVDLGSVLLDLDFARHGRSLAALGLNRFSPEDTRRALDGGDASLLEQALA